MTLVLDDNQLRIVGSRRRAPSDRPTYYNATTKKYTQISEDFEAFLILQGRPSNQTTQMWIGQCNDFETRDLDRDSLAGQALKNEIADATSAQFELEPLIALFDDFKADFDLTGFEDVVEAGLLLNDVQRAMNEILNLTSRLNHRMVFGNIALSALRKGGTSLDQQKELNSWYTPLTAY